MPIATLKFDLDDPQDKEMYELHNQALRTYFFINEFKDSMRTIYKHDTFPASIYPGMITANLTDEEKALQEKLGKPYFQLYDDDGKCTISADTMLEILRDHFFQLANDEKINLDVLS